MKSLDATGRCLDRRLINYPKLDSLSGKLKRTLCDRCTILYVYVLVYRYYVRAHVSMITSMNLRMKVSRGMHV